MCYGVAVATRNFSAGTARRVRLTNRSAAPFPCLSPRHTIFSCLLYQFHLIMKTKTSFPSLFPSFFERTSRKKEKKKKNAHSSDAIGRLHSDTLFSRAPCRKASVPTRVAETSRKLWVGVATPRTCSRIFEAQQRSGELRATPIVRASMHSSAKSKAYIKTITGSCTRFIKPLACVKRNSLREAALHEANEMLQRFGRKQDAAQRRPSI